MVLLLNNEVSEEVLDISEAIEVMEEAFVQLGEGNAGFRPRTDLWFPREEEEQYYVYGDLLGAIGDPPRVAHRLKSDIIDRSEGRKVEYNVEPGTTMRFVCLFDAANGKLLAILNDRNLQHVRVAATAGVACKHLSPTDSESVGLLGSGGMAHVYAEAFASVRDISTIKVFSPTRENREAFAQKIQDKLDINVIAVANPEKAMQNVDIAATCTNSRSAVFDSEWLDGINFITNVNEAEMDNDIFEQANVFITTNKPYSAQEIGEVENPRAALGYQEMDYLTLAELLVENTSVTYDLTNFFNNRSTGLQFAAICNLVYSKAKSQDLGKPLPLEWFQQSRNEGYRDRV